MTEQEITKTNPAESPPNNESAEAEMIPVGAAEKINTVDLPASKRGLAEITDEISFKKKKITTFFIEIGLLLIEAKEQLTTHGEWLIWLAESVDISERMAERYMQLARAYPNPTSVTNLGMTKALALLSVPENQREDFINSPHEVCGKQKSVGEMSTRELKKAIREEMNPHENDSEPQTMPVIRKNDKRKKLISDIELAKNHLDDILKFLKENQGNRDVIEKHADEFRSLHDVVKEYMGLIEAETFAPIHHDDNERS